MTTETVKPADAALLRDTADVIDGADRLYGERAFATAARLRALADVLETISTARDVEIHIHRDGSVGAVNMETWADLPDLEAAIDALTFRA
jgi:hypothetical protein